jgi:L-rhamnonate dehydratase
MNRRSFLATSAAMGLSVLPTVRRAAADDGGPRFPEPALLPFRDVKSDLKITAIRAVKLVPKRPLPKYEQASGSWNTTEVEIANPLSIYPRFKPRRSLFYADDLGPDTVMVETNKGITGFGYGGPGAAFVVERHLPKLLVGEDPFQVERLWDIMWRGTLYYGRKGLVVHAVSAVDNALWDIVGKAQNTPVYRLLGGSSRDRVPCYCTGNNGRVRLQEAEARHSSRPGRRRRGIGEK